ncbi:MAG: peptidase U32 family protein [Clostridia bacterium]
MDVLGNRGKCAQTCRLPYELIEENQNKLTSKLDKGYLLSTRDLCSLEYLPMLIDAGVTSFKIEGRMKSPEYVATVTKIYRKYIDLALDKTKKYEIENSDKIKLMQVFNRGGFSDGHLNTNENRKLVFKEKQNNMGLYLGKISKYNKNKGIVTLSAQTNLSVGDSITFEKEPTKYTVSELLDKNQNIKKASFNQTVSFGRMKGNINVGDKVYKIADKNLSDEAKNSYSKENIKNKLDCNLEIKQNQKIKVQIYCNQFNCKINYVYDYIPDIAKKASITKETIISKFNKTQDTEFEFENFDISLDDNLFIPVSVLNDIRRTGINMIREKIIQSFKHTDSKNLKLDVHFLEKSNEHNNPQISLLLNDLNQDFSKLEKVDKLYIPLKYFINDKYHNTLKYFSDNFNLYIYMPTIIRKPKIELSKNYRKSYKRI